MPRPISYLDVCWEGTVYVWACLPFGFAPACKIFTEVSQIMYRPVREAGVNLTAYIDDRLRVGANKDLAKLNALILYGLMAACGCFLNLEKSVIQPAQIVTFLGMLVDLMKAQLRVPEKRTKLIRKQL